MAGKAIIINDPGVDGAIALAVALFDDQLDIQAVCATAGNVSAEQATRNVQCLIEQFDPPRLPRIGAALNVDYEVDGKALHGPNGLGALSLPYASLHHPHAPDKLIADVAHQYPHEVTVIVLGPGTVLARALTRDTELHSVLKQVIWVGGAWHAPGDISAVADLHFYCDPRSAKQIVDSDLSLTLIPLDVSRKLQLSPTDVAELPANGSRTMQLIKEMIPFAIGSTESLYGVEGFHLCDVVGVIAFAHPKLFKTRDVHVDVEQLSELTRGMSVIDTRWNRKKKPNVSLAVDLDLPKAREYYKSILAQIH